MRSRVVESLSSREMEIAAAAIERDVTLGCYIRGGGIKGCGIGAKIIIGRVDFYIAAQSVDVARLVAFVGVDNNWTLRADGQVGFLRGRLRICSSLGWRSRGLCLF